MVISIVAKFNKVTAIFDDAIPVFATPNPNQLRIADAALFGSREVRAPRPVERSKEMIRGPPISSGGSRSDA